MLHFRFANKNDIDLYYQWANDLLVRMNSYNQKNILYKNHVKWFNGTVDNPDNSLYIFFNEDEQAVGQVRIQKQAQEIIIGISIDVNHRGKSLGVEMLKISTNDYLLKNPNAIIYAYIKKENAASLAIFEKADFLNKEILKIKGMDSYRLSKK